jgi:hypothetical protein
MAEQSKEQIKMAGYSDSIFLLRILSLLFFNRALGEGFFLTTLDEF